MSYDCIIVGGGLAGLQAAIQLGRYRRSTLVIDAEDGRSVICRRYNNILGWPEGISGPELREAGKWQAKAHGVHFLNGKAASAEKTADGFKLTTQAGEQVTGRRLLLATGVVDRLPEIPGLSDCLGSSLYVCPDCDGYEASDRKTVILGSGKAGAYMALTVRYWTNQLIYINHESREIDETLARKLEEQGIVTVNAAIERIEAAKQSPEQLHAIHLANGQRIEALVGFVAFGGNEVRSELADQLGIQLHRNRHILVDARTKMTSVPGVWAAGDIVAHSEQTVIAMGDGSQAAIWMHKTLLNEPLLEKISPPEPLDDLT
ncbi:thioredoxin reductase [Paenibacillus phyllosphaerae]|uniref:Thioredoxin reductase n=1 Tax=Paenibacillus phyllosphaerae TaxID=274593 RepID=A0A7W5FQ88_9BACL|nr:NAD(P)/FAD-dependent oxidoreductase [Paenibacillus phyllosphaerae]MBB3112977.1 thioredoxin reductase [Paenibacillus phyllosphaerae]